MKYFTIRELTHSNTAVAKGIDNTPTAEVEKNLQALIEHVLDPLREAYGKPIKVNSGYRSPKLNKVLGGVANSQHQYGYAADITAGSREGNKVLWNLAQKLKLPFDQNIDEYGYKWVHISYSPRHRRMSIHLPKK